MKIRSKRCDGHEKHHAKREAGVADNNIVGFAVAIANVTDSDECNAQANAAVFVAGDDIKAELENESEVNVEVEADDNDNDNAAGEYTPVKNSRKGKVTRERVTLHIKL